MKIGNDFRAVEVFSRDDGLERCVDSGGGGAIVPDDPRAVMSLTTVAPASHPARPQTAVQGADRVQRFVTFAILIIAVLGAAGFQLELITSATSAQGLGFAIVCALCAVLTAALAGLSHKLCPQLGLMDAPDARKLHKRSTPLVGGLTLIAVILPLSILAILISPQGVGRQSMLLYAVATYAVALVGLADDRRSLSARHRIVLGFLIFGSVSLFDPIFYVRVLTFALPGFELGLLVTPLAILFTMVCCVGLVNAVNMADGKNGLVIGLCIGWLAILTARAPAPLLPMICLLGTGLSVLLLFNLRGRLFLGDGGSYGFATAVGLLTIMIYNQPGMHAGRAIAADEIILLFIVPVLDSFRLTFVRIRRGQSPMAADRDHLHHHLQGRFGWPLGLVIYLVLALAPGAIYICI